MVPPAATRRQPRFEPAALAWREPIDVEPEGALELVQAAELLGVVAVGRHHKGSGAAVMKLGSELVREFVPQLQALEVEPQELLLAELRLGDRREHPGGHARGTRAG